MSGRGGRRETREDADIARPVEVLSESSPVHIIYRRGREQEATAGTCVYRTPELVHRYLRAIGISELLLSLCTHKLCSTCSRPQQCVWEAESGTPAGAAQLVQALL